MSKKVEIPQEHTRLFRVSTVDYLMADSPEEAADICCHVYEEALREDGSLNFVIEELEADDAHLGVKLIPIHLASAEVSIAYGECNEYEQEDFNALRSDARAQLKRKRRPAASTDRRESGTDSSTSDTRARSSKEQS